MDPQGLQQGCSIGADTAATNTLLSEKLFSGNAIQPQFILYRIVTRYREELR
jgi:hypothetical protein